MTDKPLVITEQGRINAARAINRRLTDFWPPEFDTQVSEIIAAHCQAQPDSEPSQVQAPQPSNIIDGT